MGGFLKIGLPMEGQQFEWVWARRTGRTTGIINNIPFFTRARVTMDDEVYFRELEGMLYFTRVKARSGNRTVLVAFNDGMLRERYLEILKEMRAMGMVIESATVGFLAVLVRTPEDWEKLDTYLAGVGSEVRSWGAA